LISSKSLIFCKFKSDRCFRKKRL